MKEETKSVTIEEFVGLKPKMYLLLVDDNSEHKKAKGVNRVTRSYNEQKDVLLNIKCLRHSMNRIQSKVLKQEHMKSTKFHCLVLMTKYISKTIDMVDQVLISRVN